MKNLTKITFAISLMGILLLLIISKNLESKLIDIENINNKLLNKNVKIQGNIINIKNYKDFQSISIKDSTGKITITLNKNLNLTKNQNIIITGKVKEYNQNLQIQTDKIIINK